MSNKKRKVIEYTLDETGRLGLTAISLVEFPAIEENFVFLKASDPVKFKAVEGERRMIYGPALIPDKEIYRVDPKTQEEYYVKFSRSLIERIAHDYLRKNLQHNTTLDHQMPVAGVTLVEAWLKDFDEDKSNGLGYSLPIGSWFVGMSVEDDDVWAEVKDGIFRGFSIEGFFKMAGLELSMTSEEELLREVQQLVDSFAQ